MTDDVSAAGRTVISKAAVILMTYLNGDVHTLTEIATATGLPLSTAHRLVRELAAWKILERTDDGDYCVGLPLRLIGGAAGTATSLEERACLVLQDLSQALDADVRLGVLGDRDVSYIEKPRGRRPVTHLHPGRHRPGPRDRDGQGAAGVLRTRPGRLLPEPRPDGVHARSRSPHPTGSAGRWRWPGSAGSRWPAGSWSPTAAPWRCRCSARAAGSPRRSRCGSTIPAAELPVVRPALVIAGRSLSRELAATPEMAGRGPGCGRTRTGESRTERCRAGHSSPEPSTRVPGLPCAPEPSRSCAPLGPHGR